ncbi:hypothetical protein M409DRAFT_21344 [Zasmidium cellare ATCC 36951]|uniref:Uncharacterized protein n=1 Tax=Zasmidium cellare ATCC 36951 TaxID=1080233 RepID=A0A6A6CN79_ZASCE|nr:uncharacterized protein M409DRAFT_21344 [Zasmidium cellare ATCC 36951]KAF2168595.1 hypothetical protein M409DRAFT_21344 [Zasmidium cellare ATCC 36951]
MTPSTPSLAEQLPAWAILVNIIALVLCFFCGDFVAAAMMTYHYELRTGQPMQGDPTYLRRCLSRAVNWSVTALLWVLGMGARREYAAVGFALGLFLSLTTSGFMRIARMFA